MAQVKAFLKFVKERESIRIKKADGQPAPWTKDKILQKYRFCNIRRSDDRVSRWLIQNVLIDQNIKEWGLEVFLAFSAWCRWVNWPPTIKKVLDGGFVNPKISWPRIGTAVGRIDGKVWTGAYMIRAPLTPNMSKSNFVAKDVIKQASWNIMAFYLEDTSGHVPPTCKGAWELLRENKHFGGFMAGQVVADWGYTSLLKNAPDRCEWAPVGPGSKRGFNRVMRRDIKTKIDLLEWQQKLGEWGTAIINELGGNYVNLTAMDVQNCLCEFDKYQRVKNGEGRPRANYRPETAYD